MFWFELASNHRKWSNPQSHYKKRKCTVFQFFKCAVSDLLVLFKVRAKHRSHCFSCSQQHTRLQHVSCANAFHMFPSFEPTWA